MELDELVENVMQRSYLITYSHADEILASTKRIFAQDVISAFWNTRNKSQPTHWCCAKETHQDGSIHYHMVVALTEPGRWKSVKDELFRFTGIVAHFASGHAKYNDGYLYVHKEDPHPLHSDEHQDLRNVLSSVPKMDDV